PKAFQIDNLGQEVSTTWKPEYSITGNQVSFSSTGSYDSTKVLVVELRRDPVIVNSGDNWITYFGSNSNRDLIRAIDIDGGDNIFVAGDTENFVFPEVDGELIDVSNTSNDSDLFSNAVIVAKFNSQNVLNYITVFGGRDFDIGHDIKVDGDNIFVVGRTNSDDIPLTTGNPSVGWSDVQGFLCKIKELDGTIEALKVIGGSKGNDFRAIDIHNNKIIVAGVSEGSGTVTNVAQTGAYNQPVSGAFDVIVGEIGADLNFIWLTHFGGDSEDRPVDIEFSDDNGHFFLVGETGSSFYSSQENTPPTDGFFPKYSLSDSDLFPKGNGINDNNEDIFIAEFNTGNNLLWSTFYGGGGIDRFGLGANKISVSSNNKVAIVCSTSDFSTFPLPNTYGSFFQTGKGEHVVSVFVDRKLDWSSAYGCFENNSIVPFQESGESVIYSSDGTLIAFGSTDCEPVPFSEYCGLPSSVLDYPICPPSDPDLYFQGTASSPLLQGGKDISIMGFTPSYEFKYGTYFGGNADEYVSGVANLSNGNFVFAGITESETNFPLEFPASPDNVYKQEILYGSRDNFLAKLPIGGLTITSVKENDGSLSSGLKVFPNPIFGQQSVTLTFTPLSIDSEINLVNSLGQLLKTFALKRGNSELQVEFDNLPKGAYFFTMHGSAVQVIKN
ncbi:MAG: T9SS type A sorting domain-containing protein, partial [Phaeodactylibacter sp.]|nr:T9SS type A sorting domain-containing protein [Phaeodactylibacter sp.]